MPCHQSELGEVDRRQPAWTWTLYHPSRTAMNPIGYHYYLTSRAQRLHAKSPAGARANERSITDTAGHNNDMALGVLLMTIVAAVPVLITAVFLLVFKF